MKSKPTRTPLSKAAQDARRPLTPGELVATGHDRVHTDVGRVRAPRVGHARRRATGVLCVALLGLLTTVATTRAEHLPSLAWMAGSFGRDGHSCCAELDCAEATVAVLAQTYTETLVLIGEHEVLLPTLWVHPSKNGRGYWCYVATNLPRYKDSEGVERTVPPEVPTKENSRCVFFVSYN